MKVALYPCMEPLVNQAFLQQPGTSCHATKSNDSPLVNCFLQCSVLSQNSNKPHELKCLQVTSLPRPYSCALVITSQSAVHKSKHALIAATFQSSTHYRIGRSRPFCVKQPLRPSRCEGSLSIDLFWRIRKHRGTYDALPCPCS